MLVEAGRPLVFKGRRREVQLAGSQQNRASQRAAKVSVDVRWQKVHYS